MVSKIELKSMKFYAYHGVGQQERIVGNNFEVDLVLEAVLDRAIATDNLDDTINYAEIYQLVKEEMDLPSNLLEHVAGRIIRSIMTAFPQINAIELKLSKLNPPIGGDVQSSSVILIKRND
ncbi:dihydroneopterin aldolase [Parabacteroides sp. PF5-9]|uniref:dihydroneopterin aldolase n=1 Tax=Parabacteroides sp. PF5-9 TaxID=1742404 RepID=UPI002474B5D1|nr:dihydroneopterin aldolase [Parabacteroides sp. PF5-9]MDH6357610.1 dihydroneopterin aldolase [Parabacteroides sp. PF5-9]